MFFGPSFTSTGLTTRLMAKTLSGPDFSKDFTFSRILHAGTEMLGAWLRRDVKK
jgi:hypothetical protein